MLKRWTAVLVTCGSGLGLLYIAAAYPGESITKMLLLVAGALVLLWLAQQIYQATAQAVLLTDEGLVLEDGTILAEMSNIEMVDRGVLAFKPSNGFAIRLIEPRPRGWSPGIWWRAGRRMGLGGATDRNQARFMADHLQNLLSPEDPSPED